MRRVDLDGGSQGNRGRVRGGARPSSADSRSHLRRLALEGLEDRVLLSTKTVSGPLTVTTNTANVSNLPTPTVSSGTANTPVSLSTLGNASTPTVAVDPVNPQNLIAAWVNYDPAHPIDNGQTTTWVDAAYSVDGGQTWNEFYGPDSTGYAGTSEQLDFSQSQTSGPKFFTQTLSPTIAFSHNEQAYLLTESENSGGTAGVLDLQRFDFTGATPFQALTDKPVYQWDGQDPASQPTLAVDAGVSTFGSVTDNFAGNVYVSWASTDTPYNQPPANFQPNTIRMTASSDEGQDFSHIAYVDNTSNIQFGAAHVGSAHYTQPQLTVSQGNTNGTVSPGQVTLVYDDYGTGDKAVLAPNGVNYDVIDSQTVTNGGTGDIVSGAGGSLGGGTNSYPINVNIANPSSFTLSALDVRLGITFPNLSELDGTLVPPTGSGLPSIPLWFFTNELGPNQPATFTGANLGYSMLGDSPTVSPNTTFDYEAVRAANDTTATNPYTGHYQPDNRSFGENDLASLVGAKGTQLNGVWHLVINDIGTETTFTAPPGVDVLQLNFTEGNTPGSANGPEVTVADPFTGIAATATGPNKSLTTNYQVNIETTSVSADPNHLNSTGIQAPPASPQATIASDNTLGSFSPHQGRIYVTYIGRYDDISGIAKDTTEVMLVASDDGGQSWFAINPTGQTTFQGIPLTSTGIQVNDDTAIYDGYSEGTPGGSTGRPKIDPSIAVDQFTGSVVLSWLDTRNDPSRDRVATYVAVSNDGGNTFAPETYANIATVSVNAITGQPVNLGPVPDNESSGNEHRDATFGFGQRQGLAVADGMIIPVWASNENQGTPGAAVPLSIVSSILTTAGGPRVISSTEGPVGQPGDTLNTSRNPADGSPLPNTIQVVFDRPVDPSSIVVDGTTNPIGSGNVDVYYQDPYSTISQAAVNPGGFAVGAGSTQTYTIGSGNTYTVNGNPVVDTALSGHSGEPVVDGSVSINLTASNVAHLVIALKFPDGAVYYVPNTFTGTSINTTFALPAALLGGRVDTQNANGTTSPYQLIITDPTTPGGQSGTLINWGLKLNGQKTALRVLSVTPVPTLGDPNNNGTFGYTTFNIAFDPTNPITGQPAGVGTYSYVIRPEVQDRINSFAPTVYTPVSSAIVQNGSTTPNPGSFGGFEQYNAIPTGHAGDLIVGGTQQAGTVSASISLAGTGASVANLFVFVTAPDGESTLLYNGGRTGTTLTISGIPFSVTPNDIAVDGTYTLTVENFGAGTITLNSWSLAINAQTAAFPVNSGNLMDQNANGVTGEDPANIPGGYIGLTPGDDYAAPNPAPNSPQLFTGVGFPQGPYDPNTLPLIVSGPNIVSTSVIGTGGAVSTGGTNLVVNDQVSSVNVTYDRNVQIATALPNQVLTITGPAGPIAGPQTFTSAGIFKTFVSNDVGSQGVGLALPASQVTSSTVFIQDTGLNVANLQVKLNITEANDKNLKIDLVSPLGVVVNLVAANSLAGANFSDTTFSNLPQANGLQLPIGGAQAAAPYGLIYTPASYVLGQAGSGLGALIGAALDGVWTLRITNAGTNTATLNSWSLSAQPQVPTGAGSMLSSTLTIPSFGGTFDLAHLGVNLSLAATNPSDITVKLVAPNGAATITLFSGVGGTSGPGFINTSFDDTATIPISQFGLNNNPANLTYKPAQPLSTFNGLSVDGTWTLEVFDSSSTDGNSAVLNSWSLIATPKITIKPQQVFNSTDGTVALGQSAQPIAFGTPLTSTIAIPAGTGITIQNLMLQLNITGANDSDLTATLTGPNNVTIPLFTNIGGTGTGFVNTTFSAQGATGIDSGTAPFSSLFKPEGKLALYNGIAATGNWTLTITDTNAGSAGATFLGWSLITPASSTTGLANSFNIAFPKQQLSGTYVTTIGVGTLGIAPTVPTGLSPDPSLGAGVDTNLNAGVFNLTGNTNGVNLGTQATTYKSSNVGLLVPSGSSATVPGVLQSTLNVPDSFLVQGLTTSGLAGLTVNLTINFPNDPNLSLYLISPGASPIKIRLASGDGNGASRANFTNTTFSDTATLLIDNGGAPFFGTFKPQIPLSDLAGIEAAGNWTLEIDNSNTTLTGLLVSWSLTFRKPVADSGLAETVSDQKSVNFQIFNLAPSNPLANDTWTAVGPTGVTVSNDATTGANNPGTFAGAISAIAYDPSDPSKNTVYVATSSGGIWKTTDFLTTSPTGPTYIPLTDFGPTYSLNVGGIAIFGRNNDPNQSIVIAGTGNPDGTYPYTGSGTSYPNYGGNIGEGVGFLISMDGGKSFNLVDSLVNYDSSGNPLPESKRDHMFVGDDTYQITVDPTPEPNGQVIIYAAMGGLHPGLYRSVDTGKTWTLLSGGLVNSSGNVATATSVLLDLASKDPNTGNANILYAGFQGLGVFTSTNQGQNLTMVGTNTGGSVGANNLIQDDNFFPSVPTKVLNQSGPNGNQGRIVLAKPAPTGSAIQDILYQGWLYAAVETPTGQLYGLFVTKDYGKNWTKIQLDTVPQTGQSNIYLTIGLPTNDNHDTSYDPTANRSATGFYTQGNDNLTLAVDPTNPNILYFGGTQNYQTAGLIRIDITGIFDAHSFVANSNERNDGGKLTLETAGPINTIFPTYQVTPTYDGTSTSDNLARTPAGGIVGAQAGFVDLSYPPNVSTASSSPFNLNSTLFVSNTVSFVNDGTGVTWTFLNDALKANGVDTVNSTNLHAASAFIDPLTGQVRLLLGDDQGVFTAVVTSSGSLDLGIGNATAANFSRNGNLQDEQFYNGAAQPSNVAAQAAGALFYATGQGIIDAQSDPNILSDGNLTWSDNAVVNPPANSPRLNQNQTVLSGDRSGVGIATDATGGQSGSGTANPTVYSYNTPGLGGDLTNFFRVNGNGQTNGLVDNYTVAYPFGNDQASGTSGNDASGATSNGVIPLGNFTVNPISGADILIGDALGNLYETTNTGAQWFQIGNSGNFDGTQLSALAYGAPDPSAPQSPGSLDKLVYVGTVGRVGTTSGNTGNDNAPTGGGHIYVTQTGTAPYTDISAGLDGSSIMAIYTNPDRGSHEAYAVTLNGVFYSPDTTKIGTGAGQTSWINITGNLTQIERAAFGNSLNTDSILAPNQIVNGQSAASTLPFQSNNGQANQGTAPYGGFRDVVADYRYAIPDATGGLHPVLYVAAYGGVFRSLDNGQTWTSFPNTAFDSAPADGGYLPSVQVTNLQLNLGSINPTNGRPVQVSGDPEVLLATTYGRGEFAIRLAPDVLPNTVHLDTTLPTPGGSDSGAAFGNSDITNVQQPYLDGVSEITNFGNTVTIKILDESGGPGQGTQLNLPYYVNGVLFPNDTTTANGSFSIRLNNVAGDPSFFSNSLKIDDKVVGIQATDSSGATGNLTTFSYTLQIIGPPPPSSVTLDPASDSGQYIYNGPLDNITKDYNNLVIDVTTGSYAFYYNNTVLAVPGSLQLLRSTSLNGTYSPVGSPILVGAAPASYQLLDSNLAAQALPSGTYYYKAEVIDQAGNTGVLSQAVKVVVNTVPPAQPAPPVLDPSSQTGPTKSLSTTNTPNPKFDISGIPAGDLAVLYQSLSGSTPVAVGASFGNASGTAVIQDIVGAHPDGQWVFTVVLVDVAANFSTPSQGDPVTITTSAPPQPTIILDPADDTGLAAGVMNLTNLRSPRFEGTGTAGDLLQIKNAVTGQLLATPTVSSTGSYLTQLGSVVNGVFVPLQLADGTYTLVAVTTDAAGNTSTSAPLTFTVKATPPQIVPTLGIAPADDTGLIGDGVTSNRRPHFVGKAEPGDTVKLYAILNGQSFFEAQGVASSVDGSFSIQLPNSLVDGNTQLYAQSTDQAGNVSAAGPLFNVRIITTTGDYLNAGAAQLSVFRPSNETYYTYNLPGVQVDTTPGRDIPVQYGLSGTGRIDYVAYRFNSASYYGIEQFYGQPVNSQFGQPGVSLPVSGYYAGTGVINLADYRPNTATWVIGLPTGGGATQYGDPGVDIPTPGAYNGNGQTEIAVFRPKPVSGNDGDSFFVRVGTNPLNNLDGSYKVNFATTIPGFVYKAGDQPAVADYDGVGRDEFAIYRPSTGQFFIINTPNIANPASWTYRVVTLNLPGGPNVNDVPVSEDYQGNGKADPAVYRPSNSTFYLINSATGQQKAVQYGAPGDVASAGPLLYRLSALTGQYASSGGYGPVAAGGGSGGGSTNSFGGGLSGGGGGGVSANAIKATPGTGSSGGNNTNAIAGASTGAGVALVSAGGTTAGSAGSSISSNLTTTTTVVSPSSGTSAAAIVQSAPAAAAPTQAVTVGAKTPKVKVAVGPVAKLETATPGKAHGKTTKAKAHANHPAATSTHTKAEPAKTKTSASKTTTNHALNAAAVAAAIHQLGSLKKGQRLV
jgi:subtilisin-like proprotein convertase family protein